MKLVLDTSALSRVLSKDIDAIHRLSRVPYTELIIPLAADAEIRFGYLYGNRTEENLSNYTDLKFQQKISIVTPTQTTATLYAELATWARQHGVAFGNNDLWIAATTIELGGKLLTYDADFKRLPQLRLA